MGFFGKIKNWFSARFSESSSWTALGTLLLFVGTIAKVEEAPVIAEAIISNADALAGGDYTATAIQSLGGLMLVKGFIKPDKFND